MSFDVNLISFISQIFVFIILTLIVSFLCRDKRVDEIHKKPMNVWIPVSAFIFLNNFISPLNILSFYLFIITLCVLLIGLNSLIILFFLLIGNIVYHFDYRLCILYFVMILFTHISIYKIKKFRIKLLITYLYSFVFLNLELYIMKQSADTFLIYNHSALIIWSIYTYIVYYIYNKNLKIFHFQQNLFIDYKTNVNNYYSLLHHSYELLKNNQAYISLILINIDRLKDINKLYGVSYGDYVLKIIADNIKENIKGYGDVYRLDGDTFCVIALNEKFNMMQTITEKIRLDIEIKKIIIDNNKINLSVSIGGYYGKVNSQKIDDYIEIAHESLTKSKYKGRNRVILNNHMVYYPSIM